MAAFARDWKADRQREQQTSGRGTFVPLVFQPGEAFQFDWSEDWAILGGERTKLQVAHFKLSHSRAFIVRAYLLQTHEMLFDADYNAKYGSEPGVKFYTHVSDRYAPFHTKVIAANASEARIFWTAYFTTNALWTFASIIQIRRAPSITCSVSVILRDLDLRRAFAILPIAASMSLMLAPTYKSLDPMIGGTIDFRIIGENWDETLRLAASIKAGTVAPSILMRRLAAYPKQNALAKTLREIGRLERTLFTLDWISDPALRRRTNAGLNKGEARNALARAVFFHRLGEIRDRTFENQRYRASGLNLVVSAVILWNTVYLSHAVAELRANGERVRDDLLAHIAPLGWEHITFNGDYVWPTEPLQNAFRPLRNPRSELLEAA